MIAFEPFSVDDDSISFGNGHALDEASAAHDGLLCEGAGRIACPQNARLGLVGDGRQAGRVEAGEEPLSLVWGEALDCEPMLGQRALARRGPVLGLVEEPCDTTRDEELGAGLGLELTPEPQCALRRFRVPGVRSVREPEQPALATGGGPNVPGCVLLDERHVPSAACQPVGERGAEDTGPDDDGATRRQPRPPNRP